MAACEPPRVTHVRIVHHVHRERPAEVNHLHANGAYIDERKKSVMCQYRDDSEFCISCLRYRFTDTPGEYPAVYCSCANTYCTDCARAYGMRVDCCFGDDDCPICVG
jgi:hypothetical protein